MNVKEWRKSRGFTLKQVAEMCNRKSPATVFKWEKYGIRSLLIVKKLRILSDGAITDFSGEWEDV